MNKDVWEYVKHRVDEDLTDHTLDAHKGDDAIDIANCVMDSVRQAMLVYVSGEKLDDAWSDGTIIFCNNT